MCSVLNHTSPVTKTNAEDVQRLLHLSFGVKYFFFCRFGDKHAQDGSWCMHEGAGET